MNYRDFTYNGYEGETNWYLGGGLGHFRLYQEIIKLINGDFDGNILKKNVKIAGVYGSYPGTAWNGARFETFDFAFNEHRLELEYIADFYYKNNITFILTFTNQLLKTEDFFDPLCNHLLEVFAYKNNKILICDVGLKQYIENKFPDAYEFILSTSICANKELFLKSLDDFDMSVLNYDLNHDFDFLNSIPEAKRNQVEIMVNELCGRKCCQRKLHYEIMSNMVLHHRNKDMKQWDDISDKCPCKHEFLKFDNDTQRYKIISDNHFLLYTNYVYNYEINNYIKLGYNNFKIVGRSDEPEILLNRLFEYILDSNYYFGLTEYLYSSMKTPILFH